MAICGFNEKIGSGLNLLIAGMVDALEKKAAHSTPREALAREIVELDGISSVLRTAEGEVLPEMFVGLNHLAKALFMQVQYDLGVSKSDNLADACREIGDRFIELLAQTELHSEVMRSEQNRSTSLGERAEELARWTLERSRVATCLSQQNR